MSFRQQLNGGWESPFSEELHGVSSMCPTWNALDPLGHHCVSCKRGDDVTSAMLNGVLAGWLGYILK